MAIIPVYNFFEIYDLKPKSSNRGKNIKRNSSSIAKKSVTASKYLIILKTVFLKDIVSSHQSNSLMTTLLYPVW